MSGDDKGGKWDKVEPAGKRGGRVAGESGGAGKGSKPEGQRPRRVSNREAREARQYLESVSPSQLGYMLTGSSKTLTAQQRAYAYNVAQGATKVEAYRQAYPRAKSKHTLSHSPYIAARDPRIQQEIEAYRLASEAAKHRTPQQIRDLVIQTLVQQVIDPDIPPAIRTQATKILGQVTEVAAFTERKESVVHHSSDKLRAQILEQVTALMGGKTVQGERIDSDAASLLDELTAARQDSDGPSTVAQDDTPLDTPKAK